jgi:hypothetical protein
MTSIQSLTLEKPDPRAAEAFYAAFGVGRRRPPGGTGSHRIVIGSDAGPFTDPDGFAWETASA